MGLVEEVVGSLDDMHAGAVVLQLVDPFLADAEILVAQHDIRRHRGVGEDLLHPFCGVAQVAQVIARTGRVRFAEGKGQRHRLVLALLHQLARPLLQFGSFVGGRPSGAVIGEADQHGLVDGLRQPVPVAIEVGHDTDAAGTVADQSDVVEAPGHGPVDPACDFLHFLVDGMQVQGFAGQAVATIRNAQAQGRGQGRITFLVEGFGQAAAGREIPRLQKGVDEQQQRLAVFARAVVRAGEQLAGHFLLYDLGGNRLCEQPQQRQQEEWKASLLDHGRIVAQKSTLCCQARPGRVWPVCSGRLNSVLVPLSLR